MTGMAVKIAAAIPAVAALLVSAGMATGLSGRPEGVMTGQQVSDGERAYRRHCAMCHGTELLGPAAPALIGSDVMDNFETVAGLYGYISVAMPPQAPGLLDEKDFIDITAYILAANGAMSGQSRLTANRAINGTLSLVALTAKGPPASAPADAEPAAAVTDVPQAFTWGRTLPSVTPPATPAP